MSREEELLIGEPVFGDQGSQKSSFNNFKLKPGNNVFRILPPIMSLATNARGWYQYWRVHFGVKNSQGRMKIVVCTEDFDFRTKVVNKKCPLCEEHNRHKREYEQLKAVHEQNPNKVTKEQLRDFYENKVNSIKPSGKYYVNAVDGNGEIGILAVSKTVKDGIDTLAQRLVNEEGINPLSVNGIYLEINRSGEGLQTKYTVNPLMVADPNNPRSKTYRDHVITPEFARKIKSQAQDLSKLYTPITDEQMTLITEASPENRGAIVDKIFARPEKAQKEESPTNKVSLGGGMAGVVETSVDTNGNLKVSAPEAPKTPTVETRAEVVQSPPVSAAPSSTNSLDEMSAEELERLLNS